jgi:acyl-CoA thioester hydrolase
MGVVHHSNHVKYFEDARVEWLRARGMIEHHAPYGHLTFAVTSLEVRYFKPARFDDELEILLQARTEGLRIHMQYALFLPRLNAYISDGRTVLVPLDDNFKPRKLPEELVAAFKAEPWSEAWPPPSPSPSASPSRA